MKKFLLALILLVPALASAAETGSVSVLRYGSTPPSTCTAGKGWVWVRNTDPLGPHWCIATDVWARSILNVPRSAQIIKPVGDISALEFEQTSTASPTGDIVTVWNSGRSTRFLSIDSAGSLRLKSSGVSEIIGSMGTATAAPSSLGKISFNSAFNEPTYSYNAGSQRRFTFQDILTTKGDIYVRDGNGDLIRLPVGSNTQVLTADSTVTAGVKWAAGGGGGSSNNLINLQAATTDFTNTAGPDTLYTFTLTGGTMGATECVQLVFYGGRASGSTGNMQFGVSFGGTTMNWNSTSSTGLWTRDWKMAICNNGSTSSQIFMTDGWYDGSIRNMNSGTASVNTASDVTVNVVVTNSAGAGTTARKGLVVRK